MANSTEAGDAVAIEHNDTIHDLNDTAKITSETVIYPYGFVAEDWYWMVQLAWTNSIMPALLYVLFKYAVDSSKRREEYLRDVMFVHLATWGPTILLGFIVATGAMKGFTATWLKHYSSNMNKLAYDYSKWSLLFLAVVEGGWWNWSIFFFYWFYI